MKKLKTILIMLVLTSMLFILVGCTVESSAESEKRIETRFVFIDDAIDGTSAKIYYDKETKVQYLYNFKVGCVVLVDAEGKPLLYEEE